MELKDTVELMLNSDYKERFKAEYFQCVIRYEKLKEIIERYDRNNLGLELTCPKPLYIKQLKAMEEYIKVLRMRAIQEGIEI